MSYASGAQVGQVLADLMLSEPVADIHREQQDHLVARNAQQLGNVIKRTYRAVAVNNDTNSVSCLDEKSADESLSCISTEITRILGVQGREEHAYKIRQLTKVSS